MKKKILYLASPYGFTDAGRKFMNQEIVPRLIQKFKVSNPWDDSSKYAKKFDKISKEPILKIQLKKFKKINMEIGKMNKEMIDKSKYVLAILDGTDVDSGVAAEIGYAFVKKKKIFGYRSDFRQTGDNIGSIVNLQVEFFINESGGLIFQKIEDMETWLNRII